MDTKEIMQNAIWSTLYGDLVRYFAKLGTEDHCGRGDFWVVNDYYGWPEHRVFMFNLDLLTLQAISDIQKMLPSAPGWCVTFVVDVVAKENEWPPMGVTIRKSEIIDALLRDYLPERFRFFKIPGSRPGTGYD
jgi:hypothetical protein